MSILIKSKSVKYVYKVCYSFSGSFAESEVWDNGVSSSFLLRNATQGTVENWGSEARNSQPVCRYITEWSRLPLDGWLVQLVVMSSEKPWSSPETLLGKTWLNRSSFQFLNVSLLGMLNPKHFWAVCDGHLEVVRCKWYEYELRYFQVAAAWIGWNTQSWSV